MNGIERVTLKVLLHDGCWGRRPSEKLIAQTLHAFKNIIGSKFVEPAEDVLFEVALTVDADLDWGNHENVSDRIIERLLRRFEPEYESMVEVEVEDAR